MSKSNGTIFRWAGSKLRIRDKLLDIMLPDGIPTYKRWISPFLGAGSELCDLGEVLTKGKERRKFAQHRERCYAFIREANKRDGLDQMSVDEIEKELGST